jgi:hypothetical protein
MAEPGKPDDIIDAVSEPVPPRRRGAAYGGVIVVALLVVLAVAGAVYGPALLARYLPGDETGLVQVQGEIGKLGGQIGGQTRDLADLRTQLEAQARQLREVATLATTQTTKLGAVESGLAELAAKLAERNRDDPALADKVAALTKTLEDLMEARAAAADDMRAAALVLAVGQLRDTALRGAPYATELDAVNQLGAAPADTALAAAAARGIPSIADLQAGFAQLAPRLAASAEDGDGQDWLAPLRRLFARIVSIRRTGEVAGDGNEAVVARIEQRLAARDLEAAVDEAGKLSGAAADLARDWRARAERRVAVEKSLEALHKTAIARLARKS